VVVELRDQVSVSKADDVKVSIDTERTSPGDVFAKLTGQLTWPATVPANGESVVKLGHRIELPDGWKF
jgi:hypothetical protein